MPPKRQIQVQVLMGRPTCNLLIFKGLQGTFKRTVSHFLVILCHTKRDMKAAVYCLANRHGTYYFRIRLPNKLRLLLNQESIRFSLRTKLKIPAALKALVIHQQINKLFDFALYKSTDSMKNAQNSSILESDTTNSYDQIWKVLMEKHDGVYNEALIELMNIGIEHLRKIHVDEPDLLNFYSNEQIEDFGYKAIQLKSSKLVEPEQLLSATKAPQKTPKHSVSPAELVDSFIKDNKSKWSDSEQEISRLKVVERLISYVAGDKGLAGLALSGWSTIFELPHYLPKNTNASNVDNALPAMMKALESQEEPKESCIQRGTITEHQNRIKALCRLSFDLCIIDRNYLEKKRVTKPSRKEKSAHKYRTFEPNEIQIVLNEPLYTNDQKIDPRSKHPAWKFWLLPMAFYTGMRQGELSQLLTNDLKLDSQSGIYYLDINENAEGLSLKTASSARKVPVHPCLIELGLIKYFEELEAQKIKYAFPDLWCNAKGAALSSPDTNRVNKFFNGDNGKSSKTGYFKKCGVTREKLVFHSTRHTFINQLRTLGVDDAKIAPIVGHETGLMTSHYGQAPSVTVLYETVCKLDYGAAGSLAHMDYESYKKRSQ